MNKKPESGDYLTAEDLAKLDLDPDAIENMNLSKALLPEKLAKLKTGAPEASARERDPLAPENLERSFKEAVNAVLEAMRENISLDNLALYDSTEKVLRDKDNIATILEMATAKYGHEKVPMQRAMEEAVENLIETRAAEQHPS